MAALLDSIPRVLLDSGAVNLGNGSTIIPTGDCYCESWLESKGTDLEQKVAQALQWFAFGSSVAVLIFYAYEAWKATCGWEEVYVCCVEMTKVIIEFFHEYDSPAFLMLSTGNRVLWMRYAEWLLTCPVILIHLSNLTGLSDDYNKRTMRLLVSDIGTIVMGATAAMAQGYVRAIFFCIGVCYGANTFFHAAKVYIESYHTVPKGICRLLVRIMAWLFFISWGLFPVMFLLGPEGFNHISMYGSTIGHTVIDLMSKTCWGFVGHYLRVKIHEHILLYGDIRKTTKLKIAGQELEVETMVAEEDEETVKKPTSHYANRESFLVMRDKLKEKGYEVRASLDNGPGIEAAAAAAVAAAAGPAADKHGLELSSKIAAGGGAAGFGAGAAGSVTITPGRVILAVPDISMVDFFREQFAQLPVPYEVVPALGVDNTLALVQQAAALGGCDFVLMHPEFVRDRGATGLVARLRSLGQRTAAFGWAQIGPVRDLIEAAGLDGWLEGPSFGAGISIANLVGLIGRMQAARRMGLGGMMGGVMMGGAGGMMGGGMGMGMGGGMMAQQQMSAGGAGMGGMGMGTMGGMGAMGMGGGSMMAQQQQLGGGGLTGMGSAQSPAGARLGNNPLFNTAPSPLSSQPGGADGMGMSGGGMGMGAGMAGMGMAGMGMPGGAAQAAGAGGAPAMGGGASEAEMLQQLMAEINRLKSELGEQH